MFRAWVIRSAATLLLGAACGVQADPPRADTTRGFGSYFEAQPGVNINHKDYRSCSTELLESLSRLRIECADCQALQGEPVKLAIAGGDQKSTWQSFKSTMEGRQYPTVPLGKGRLVHLGEHELVLRSLETYHKSISDRGHFDGYYVLYPRDAIEELIPGGMAYIRGMNVPMLESPGSDDPALAEKEFYAFSVAQYADLTRADFEVALWNPPPAKRDEMSIYGGLPFTPGVFKTGRGTVYHFLPSGKIVVQKRNGESLELGPEQKENYASHAAILRRQGVKFAESSSCLELVYVGMKAVNEQMEKVPAPVLQLHQRMVDKIQFEKWQTLGEDIKKSAAAIAEHLPDFLRWTPFRDSYLYRAPRPGLRKKTYSILLIRGSKSYFNEAFAILGIHMQVAYANLLSLALELDSRGLLTGASVEVTYDEEGAATEMVLLGRAGMMSVARKERQPLSDDDVEWLVKELERSAPFSPGKKLAVRYEEE